MIWLGITMLALVSACNAPQRNPTAPAYDLVILNGRVMDPASGLDAVRALRITGGTIRAVSAEPRQGRETLDALGMVVAPGFIDLHQHAQDAARYRVAVLDGTTTALELEGGTADVDRWYDERTGKSPINHGVSIGHDQIRMRVMGIEAADNDDWQSWPERKFERFEWVLTGERLTRASFANYRSIGGLIVDYHNTEEVVTAAVADSLTMIASDGILHDGVGHPRVAGTFARVLGRYVRELRTLTLMDALRKMTIEPAPNGTPCAGHGVKGTAPGLSRCGCRPL